MSINIGDKFVVTKKLWFVNEGDIVTITNVDNDIVSFTFDEECEFDKHIGYVDCSTFEKHFKKVANETNNKEYMSKDGFAEEYIYESVGEIIKNSEFKFHTVFDKCLVVSCRLPSGFIITESYSFVDFEDYDEELAKEICRDKITDKVLELEKYRFKQMILEESMEECECTCDGNCAECAYNGEPNHSGMSNQ